MSSQYHWSHVEEAHVLAGFFYGYVCSQLLGSLLSARLGGRRVLFWATVVWSLATLLTPEAAQIGMPLLVTFRVILGLAEGFAFPSIYQIFSTSDADQRSRNIGAVHTGGFVGEPTCPPCVQVRACMSVCASVCMYESKCPSVWVWACECGCTRLSVFACMRV